MSALSDEPKADFGAWWLAVLLAIYYAISYVDRFILVHVIEYIKADLSVSDFQMGLVIGPVFAFAYGAFGVPFGWAADRLQRRIILFIGITLWSAATATTAFADTYAELVACRIAVAVGEAALMPAAASILADRFPRPRLASAMAVFTLGSKAGQSIGYLIAGMVIAYAQVVSGTSTPILGDREIWQIVLLVVGIPGLILAPLIWTIHEPRRQAGVATPGGQETSLVAFMRAQYRVILPMFFGFCAAAVTAQAVIAWVPTFFVRTYGWTADKYGPWLGAVSALGAVMMLAKGAVIDWMLARGIHDASVRLYVWLLIIFSPVAIFAYFAPSPYIFLFAFFFVNAVALPMILFALTSVQLFTPSQLRGRVIALFLLIIPMISQSIGPPLVSIFTDFVFRDPARIGWSLSAVTAMSITVAVFLLSLALKNIAPPEREAPIAAAT